MNLSKLFVQTLFVGVKDCFIMLPVFVYFQFYLQPLQLLILIFCLFVGGRSLIHCNSSCGSHHRAQGQHRAELSVSRQSKKQSQRKDLNILTFTTLFCVTKTR